MTDTQSSILNFVKVGVGLEVDDTDFDDELIGLINGVFPDLFQLGIGPSQGFEINNDSATWDQYLESDLNRSNVKTYMRLRVRMLFDPPGTSYHLASMQDQIQELAWRINVNREEEKAALEEAP